jgi:hypothetical protein
MTVLDMLEIVRLYLLRKLKVRLYYLAKTDFLYPLIKNLYTINMYYWSIILISGVEVKK